jgi:hypothetical protein
MGLLSYQDTANWRLHRPGGGPNLPDLADIGATAPVPKQLPRFLRLPLRERDLSERLRSECRSITARLAEPGMQACDGVILLRVGTDERCFEKQTGKTDDEQSE